jgi:hypothetical protein
MILFISTFIFLAVLSVSLFLIGYFEGKSAGLREGRKDLADFVMGEVD